AQSGRPGTRRAPRPSSAHLERQAWSFGPLLGMGGNRCREKRGEWTIEQEEPGTSVQEDLTPDELIAAIEESMKNFNDGGLVKGTVVKIDRDEVLVDIGYK